MKVFYINNDGGGFASDVDIKKNTTVEKFYSERFHDRSPEDFLIRVNRQPVPSTYVLQEGDRITMTPTKIHGASAAA